MFIERNNAMSLENIRAVDAVGVDKFTNAVVLTIIDSWDWTSAEKHLAALQEKLNAYFEFVESGQIYTSYPDAIGKMFLIDIVHKYPLPAACLALLKMASEVASQLNIAVTSRLHT